MSSRKIPDAETLQKENGYRMILELDFNDIIPFVFSNIRKASLSSLFYLILNFASLLFIIGYALWSVKSGNISIGMVILQALAGILAGSILVIPPHELLHGLAYRILGARNIKFGVDLKQFIFYVTAHRFPISKRELAFLAMTPFVMINLVLILITVVWVPQIMLLSASLLLSHNIMCIGDFAMISYALRHKQELYTFDDTGKKLSYFFEREEPVRS
jgi:hypothetical protein